MATNEILQFASTDTGTNLLTQAEYSGDAQRPIGNQAGVARSKLVNKALKQSSLLSAGLAQFLADNQNANVTDLLIPSQISAMLSSVVSGLGIRSAPATGTANALIANFFNDVVLTNGVSVIVRAGLANTATAVTFSPDGIAPKTIVKGNNLPLDIGDIAGAGHWLELQYDTVLDKWVLQNPAFGVSFGAKFLSAAGYQKLPSGLILQWGGGTSDNTVISYPIAFPTSVIMGPIGGEVASGASTTGRSIMINKNSLTGFQLYIRDYNNTALLNQTVNWFVIGY